MKFSKFFSNVQETNWYRCFLNPVINEIDTKGKLLDIGMGSGKLIQIVSNEKGINCTGVDTNIEMLKEAKIKLKGMNISVFKIDADKKLPFENGSFNFITICSVLFHLKNKSIDLMLKDAQRLLKKDGKIIVLTPTGKGNIISLTKSYFSFRNASIYIWFYATRNRAVSWTRAKFLEQYANDNGLYYKSQMVMNGFAQLEIIKK